MFLEVKDLIKSYADNLPVLKKLNFQLQKGELLSFVGESGAGKSTFLKCLSGLEKIDGGEIILNGKIISSHNTFIPPQQRKISYVFQDYALFPHLNIRENICFIFESKLLKGSSNNNKSGSLIIDLAIQALCCSPPEIS